MGFKPDITLRLEDIKRKSDTDSLFFKGVGLLNRSNSAVFGGLSEAIEGRDPLSAIADALTGKREFGGKDFLAAAFDVDPESKLGRRGGLALDILNPLDPLNFVGLGGLTKAGKVAKLGRGIKGVQPLAKGFGTQARAGQRGLLNFAGRRVPLPGDAVILDALQRGGGVVKESRAGKGIRQLFGGKKGFLETQLPAEFAEENLRNFELAQDLSERNANIFGSNTDKFLNDAKANLKRAEYPDFLRLIDQTGRPTGSLEQDIIKFVGTGSGAARRQKAVVATMGFFQGRHEAAQQFLGGMGAARFTKPEIGFISRKFKFDPTASNEGIRRFFGPKRQKTGQIIELQGRSDNSLNRALVQSADQPVSREGLTEAGRREFDKNGAEFFENQRINDPKAHVAFQNKHRNSVQVEAQRARDFNSNFDRIGEFEEDPIRLLRGMQDEMANGIRTSSLIEGLEDAGITVPWDSIKSEELGKFIKIDQGKWGGKPIGIPAIYGDAYEKYQEVFFPGPDKPMMAQFMNEVFGETLGNLGMMSWWKGFAIVGAGPTAFWTRNFATGVMKNYYEGLGPTSPRGLSQARRFYTQALVIVGESLGFGGNARVGQRLDLSGAFASGDVLFKLGDGTTLAVSRTRIMEDYMAFGMHGGGSPNPEIIRGLENASTAARQAVFGHFHRGNFRVEMAMRMPLMMKFMEDTFEVARKAGVKMPNRIGPRRETPEVIGDLFDRAVTNAREAVLRAHFDYDDLTPFERRLRASFIPFYTWMRKNIPNETINMVQNSGRYMPFARAYYSAFQQQGITPEDLPEWAQRGFAVPLDPSGDERVRWLDFTGFLPFLDIAELGQALGTGLGVIEPQTGKTRQSEVIRYMATRFNPFVTQVAEQGLQKNFFTGRSFSGDVPQDVLGITASADKVNLTNLLRPLRDIDRLNPGNIFGESPRPGRNEPEFGERLARLLTGVKVRATDKDEASLSLKRRRSQIRNFENRARRARRNGEKDRAEFFALRARQLKEGVQ